MRRLPSGFFDPFGNPATRPLREGHFLLFFFGSSTMRSLLTLFLFTLMVCLPAPSRADDCAGRSLSSVEAEGAEGYGVYLSHTSEGWSFVRWYHGEKAQGVLPQIGEHAHLYLMVPAEAGHFLVLDSGAGHHLEGRVLLYSDTGELEASLGLDELLTDEELERVMGSRSISHLSWLDPHTPPHFAEDGTTAVLTVTGGREVEIPTK